MNAGGADDAAEARIGARLPRSFYQATADRVAPAMIGKLLVHATDAGIAAGRIVETEAYCGPEDGAAHSRNWRRTPRTETMWGPPGHAYMFLIYGLHWCFNAVVAADGVPHAVLVRAVAPVVGRALMARRRGKAPSRRDISNGPGKLCAALGLDAAHKGADLVTSGLFLAEDLGGDGESHPCVVKTSPRINIDYAGAWVDKPWRWYVARDPYVSVNPRT
ncbi:MAG: DNA-3-methyladenine glycosylase [Myxococcota bacterium]